MEQARECSGPGPAPQRARPEPLSLPEALLGAAGGAGSGQTRLPCHRRSYGDATKAKPGASGGSGPAPSPASPGREGKGLGGARGRNRPPPPTERRRRQRSPGEANNVDFK